MWDQWVDTRLIRYYNVSAHIANTHIVQICIPLVFIMSFVDRNGFSFIFLVAFYRCFFCERDAKRLLKAVFVNVSMNNGGCSAYSSINHLQSGLHSWFELLTFVNFSRLHGAADTAAEPSISLNQLKLKWHDDKDISPITVLERSRSHRRASLRGELPVNLHERYWRLYCVMSACVNGLLSDMLEAAQVSLQQCRLAFRCAVSAALRLLPPAWLKSMSCDRQLDQLPRKERHNSEGWPAMHKL